jgi:acetyl esterase/lipase
MKTLASVLLVLAAMACADEPQPAAGPAQIVRHLNLPYHKIDQVDPNLLSLDVYAPAKAKDAPVMVMIHGGGWAIGDKANRGLIEGKVPWFTRRGWVFVSVNYRLSPQVRHPEHVRDVARALAWVHEKIQPLGGDPSRIFVMGHSAGAHLAALVAIDPSYLKAHDKPLSILKGVILLDGAGYDIPTHLAMGAGPMLRRMYVRAFTDDARKQRQASPITHVAQGQGIPPFLIIHVASRRASGKRSEDLARKLKQAKVPAEVFAAQGQTHRTINTDFGKKDHKATRRAEKFLRGCLEAIARARREAEAKESEEGSED